MFQQKNSVFKQLQQQQSKVKASVATESAKLQTPHGGELVNLYQPKDKAGEFLKTSKGTIELSDRNACDVELLAGGAFSPLTGFMDEVDYQSVVDSHRLKDGTLFGLPIVLDTRDNSIQAGDRLTLQYKDQVLGVVDVSSKYRPNKVYEAKQCYGTTSLEHPAVQMITMERGPIYLGGKVTAWDTPKRVFPCQTPAQVRESLIPGRDVVAFQCRNPIHRAHYELFTKALSQPNVGKEAICLVHPTCGPTQDDDIPGDVRYRTYEVLKNEVKNPYLRWAYLPYSMHMAGPREALQHIIIRKNFGCTHFIIGRDMAGSKSSLTGVDFYGPYDAQNFAKEISEEVGVQPVPSLNIVYTQEKGYVTDEEAKGEGLHVLKLSGTQFRKMLRAGDDIPDWFSFKSVIDVLRETV